MKTESKFLLSLALFFIIIALFAIIYAFAKEFVESNPSSFSIGFATLVSLLMFSVFYFGFNINKSSR